MEIQNVKVVLYYNEHRIATVKSLKGSLVQRVDSPESGGNVRKADKGGAGPAGLSREQRD